MRKLLQSCNKAYRTIDSSGAVEQYWNNIQLGLEWHA